ncbi:MAG: alpha/beta fold hydrolase [Streptosporangiaceae bacterium]
MVLLHPAIGDSRIWDHVWPALTATCRVIRYDVRGFGRSTAPTQQYTRLDDLRKVLAHFRVDRMHLVGAAWAAPPPSTWPWPSPAGSRR